MRQVLDRFFSRSKAVDEKVAVGGGVAAESFQVIMSSGVGSLKALIESSTSLKQSIATHGAVIDRVIAQHGGLKNFQPSALFESPQHLVAGITGDVSLAGLFRAQAVAKGLYPAQALPERAKHLRDFDMQDLSYR
jgi:hypothetical protein